MTPLAGIALVLAIIALILAITAHARLHIADDLRDEHSETLGVGSDSFPHERSNAR